MTPRRYLGVNHPGHEWAFTFTSTSTAAANLNLHGPKLNLARRHYLVSTSIFPSLPSTHSVY